MNAKIFLSILFSLFLLTVKAQSPIATLEHNDQTQVYYGQDAFIQAYNNSQSGDYIYLSAGFFTPPEKLAKKIKVIGAGHFPDSLNKNGRTTISGSFNIQKYSDDSVFEGLFIDGDINFDPDNKITDIKFLRCKFNNAFFNSQSSTANKNNCSFIECYIFGGINFSQYGSNFLVRNCIICGKIVYGTYTTYRGYVIENILGDAIIDRNIILTSHGFGKYGLAYFMKSVNNSIIKNNIIFCPANSTGTNFEQNNLYTSADENIFIDQKGNIIDYTHNYHLKEPESYQSTDGTQIGIYGGNTPFKDKGLPSNPQIISNNISGETDNNGMLKINITVEAQSR